MARSTTRGHSCPMPRGCPWQGIRLQCMMGVRLGCAEVCCRWPGEGRVHKCLWDNKDSISKNCQAEERKIQIMQSSNTELMPNLAKACKLERAAHCKAVRPGKSRVYNCLVSNSDSVRHRPATPWGSPSSYTQLSQRMKHAGLLDQAEMAKSSC